ncbi:MAG TPA: NAD(P)H-binding protein [Bacteroidota bacterium]|nr:NAD(P)H-binding protein [Bacteroidota bacterium]
MSHLVAVTGSTGNVGKVLVRQLLKHGVRVRAIGRTLDKLAPLVAEGAEKWPGDLQDTDFVVRAFAGADAVFAMLPEHPNSPDFLADKRRSAASLAEALRRSHIRRVVALSAIGVNPPSGIGPAVANAEFETMLQTIPGLSVVALRAAFLMENLLPSIQIIKTAGVNGSPIRADIALPMVSTSDIASVASGYLIDPTFDGYTVRPLLGPRDYTHREATAILGAAIGRPELVYVEFPFEGFRQGLAAAGFSSTAANAVVELFMAFNEDRMRDMASRDASNTTPTTLEEFARDVFAPAYRAS